MKTVFLCLVACFLFACAPKTHSPEVDGRSVAAEDAKQNELVAQMQKERYQRLVDVSDPLLRNNVEICGAKVATSFGVDFVRSGDLDGTRGRYLAKAFHLGPKLTATLLPVHGQAYRAGMREGDELVSVNGKPVPEGKRAGARLLELLKDEVKTSPVVTFKVLRRNVPWSFVVRGVPSCNMPVLLENNLDINAYADGKSVVVATGMLNFASDEELAVIIGHEMAHNAMLHPEQGQAAAEAGLYLDMALEWLSGVPSGYFFTQTGRNAYSHAQEFEADYVGMYIAARGGYAVDKATEFWRKVSATLGQVNQDSNSHPNTPERYLKIQAIADEIWLKKSKGEPLLPEMKDGGPFKAPSLEEKEKRETAEAGEKASSTPGFAGGSSK
ncbi:M48 family metallopeptidase [Paucidesulfovibrio longus]|uniref:M48 family metallopeptidase n=1 Tax=Paucidesulfovibrio longus TaxID=889 RepID=UPI0003B78CF9|nr:M48 family metallopeptidase [Paucidesulfovibrio longus]